MKLFHYTCSHGALGITRRGWLWPQAQPVLDGRRLVWLTDQSQPNRYGLGLTSNILDCDRLEFRYVVDCDFAHPWRDWLKRQPPFSVEALIDLHGPGRQPEHWFVTEKRVWAELDRSYKQAEKAGRGAANTRP